MALTPFGKSSVPGTIVPLDDVTQIDALLRSEQALQAELQQRKQVREQLEENRGIVDQQMAEAEATRENERIQSLNQHEQDAFVVGDKKPAIVELSARDHFLESLKTNNQKITNIKEQLSNRVEFIPDANDPELPVYKTYIYNEDGELIGGENLNTSDYEKNKEQLAELVKLQEEQAKADAECGSFWFCSTCEFLDKDWYDIEPLSNDAQELLRLGKLKAAIDDGDISSFSRYLQCLKKMGSSKTSQMTKAVLGSADAGLPGMLSAGITELPIANKSEVLRPDLIKCATNMAQDPTSIGHYADVLTKTGIAPHEIVETSVPGLGVSAIDISRTQELAKNGNALPEYLLGKEYYAKVNTITHSSAFSKIL